MKLIDVVAIGEPECLYEGVFVGTYFKKWKNLDGSDKKVVFTLNADQIEYIRPTAVLSTYEFKLKPEKQSLIEKLLFIKPDLVLDQKIECEKVQLTYIKMASGAHYYVIQTVDEIKNLINN